MSNYAVHELSWDGDMPTEGDITQRLAQMTGEGEEFAKSAAFDGEAVNWSDSDEHITALSRQHPGTVFTLSCKGEDGGHSVSFFRDGMMQTLQVEPPHFDPHRFAAEAKPGPVPK